MKNGVLHQVLLVFWGVVTICTAQCGGESIQKNAKLSHTHYLLGQDYIGKKNPEAAKGELVRALELDSENEDAHRLLGAIFFLEGVHAMNFLERQNCLSGKAAEEQRQEANKKFRTAETHLRKALSLSAQQEGRPNSEDLNYLSSIALHFERFDESIRYADQAMQNILYANRHMALGNRGWAYYKKGDLTAAARDLRQSLFQQPKFCVGRYRLAEIYHRQNQLQKAFEELQTVVDEKDCPLQEAYELMGIVSQRLGKVDGAKEIFRRCIDIASRSCIANKCEHYLKLL